MELKTIDLKTIDPLIIIQQLEKENRILQKKLERSEKTVIALEQTSQKREFLLRKIIQELEDSQREVQEKRQLEETLIQLKLTQSQLIHAEKMSSLGQLVAGVAHEINNPVNFIHGNLTHLDQYSQNLLDLLQLYQQCYPTPIALIQDKSDEIDLVFLQADLVNILNSLRLGTDRIRKIVLSLRNFSRIDESDLKPVDIHEGIDSTLEILQHRLKSKSEGAEIQIIRNYGKLPKVECYAGQLNQVFMNIITNAIDALEEQFIQQTMQERKSNPGQITISTSMLSSESILSLDWVQIVFTDNGSGISESIKEKIFNPFFTTKPIGKGTGMGMAISHQIIVEKHGGQLVCSSNSDIGTEFIIRIPVQKQSE